MSAKHFLWAGLSGWAIWFAACDSSVSVEPGGSAGAGQGGAGAGAQSGTAASSAGGGDGSTTTTSSGGGGGAGAGGAGAGGCSTVPSEKRCNEFSKPFDCGDTIDNDGDGLIDAHDPDCLGVCDNDEDSYFGSVPGSLGPPCLADCFFDRDKGYGNDECYWSFKCDPFEQTPPGHPQPYEDCAYDPAASIPSTLATCDELQAKQNDVCLAFCGHLTPNGCDCFGCCELPAGSGQYAWLGSKDNVTGDGTCTSAVEDNPELCEPCTPVMGCLNSCETCELCVGRPTLPPECAGSDGELQQECAVGVQKCGVGCQEECPAQMYCVTGCCQPFLME